jgi:hypothetical protein
MGISQSDKEENRQVILKNTASGSYSDKGFISRFGVGAKSIA